MTHEDLLLGEDVFFLVSLEDLCLLDNLQCVDLVVFGLTD